MAHHHFNVHLMLLALLTVSLTIGASDPPSTKPHIIVIMADDMGFNDVGFHGSDQIPTPNIDALAAYGIALNRYYVAPLCTPSRASLMSGKYPSHVGMQHFVIASEMPFGLGLEERLLPEYMRAGGYRTHAIGKWHLGYYMKRYTPTQRGFDSHYGYLGPYIDYYTHSLLRQNIPWPFDNGYDMRSNLSVSYDHNGTYATDLFTQVAVDTIHQHPKHLPLFMYLAHLAPHTANEADPLQVPADELAKFAHIEDPDRRRYAAMVSRLDAGVGRVVDALRAAAMLENSVILFFSDNGAPVQGMHANRGSNWPFKGQKESPWDGAVRSAAAIWSPLLAKRQRVSEQLFHISDWLPTFAHLAGVPIDADADAKGSKLDGHNIWPALATGAASPRSEVLCALDPADGYGSLVRDSWKLVNGSSYGGKYDAWISDAPTKNVETADPLAYGEAAASSLAGRALKRFAVDAATFGASEIQALRADGIVGCGAVPMPDAGEESDRRYECRPLEAPCLFNILDDPCERRNLADIRPDVLHLMQQRLQEFVGSAKALRNRQGEERSNPKHFNGTWTWWYDELGLKDHSGGGGRCQAKCWVAIGAAVLVVVVSGVYQRTG